MSNGKCIFTSIISGIIAGAGTALVVVALVITLIIARPDWVGNIIERSQPTPTGSVSEQVASEPSAAALSQEQMIIETVKKVKPAVVSIVITKDVPIIEEYYEDFGGQFGNEFGFDPFFMPMPQYRQNGTQEQEIGGGSGFIVSADGYVITNKHVIDDPDASYTVFTNDGTKYEAQIVDRDPLNDVAVLKIQGENLPYLEFGDSEQVQVGQTAIAIGNALSEFSNSVSVGVVSGLARSIEAGDGYGQLEELDNVIQTDAAINPGNSGGPLLNLQGQVIGVNVAVAYGSENIGFALPGNLAKTVVESVKANGKIVRPYLGVRYVEITAELQEANSLGVDYGVLVARGETVNDLAVIPGSPADKAGLRENDIILEIDGQKLNEERSLASIIGNKKVGDVVKLKLLRQGTEQEIEVTLEERSVE